VGLHGLGLPLYAAEMRTGLLAIVAAVLAVAGCAHFKDSNTVCPEYRELRCHRARVLVRSRTRVRGLPLQRSRSADAEGVVALAGAAMGALILG
jgi:hypothetical protein